MVVIVIAAAPDERCAHVGVEVRRKGAHHTPAAPGDGLRPFELDDTFVLGQPRHIGLNGGFANILLASERGEAQLVAVPRIHWRSRLAVSGLEPSGLSK